MTNKLILITAPSGAGKTTITRFLLEKFPNRLAFSVSAATRKARGNEQDGVEYHFISTDSFRELIGKDAFLEWEMVYEGKYYGTLRSEVRKIWDQGKVPLLDIDVKGAMHVKEQFPETALTIFIEPPSLEELGRRLRSRGTETEESIRARLEKSAFELSFRDRFDRVVLNDDLQKACLETAGIVDAFIGGPLASPTRADTDF